ncbi:uncharacterized [Tachysurus ichikawai]
MVPPNARGRAAVHRPPALRFHTVEPRQKRHGVDTYRACVCRQVGFGVYGDVPLYGSGTLWQRTCAV